MALSTDVVMGIVMSHLNGTDLLSCRLVSKFWNKAASSVLRQRSTMMETISEEDKLMELEECMRESSDFPFTGLSFDQPWLFNSDRSMEFFQNYGDRFTRLALDTHWEHKLHDLAPFIDYLPRLSILETGRESSCTAHVDLSNFVGQREDKILRLPSVETLRIHPYRNIHEDVLRQVLEAASPSLQIECLEASPEILGILKNIGKLRAVSSIKFDSDGQTGQDYVLKLDHLSLSESPMLTKLYFTQAGCLSLDGLMGILLSSQHTLQEMELDKLRLCDFTWEKFPVLSKLTYLNLTVHIEADQDCKYLFIGQHGHKFPALNELELDMYYVTDSDEYAEVIWSDGLFIVPSLESISIGGYVSEGGMKELAKAFPNVVEVGLHYSNYSDNPWKTRLGSPFEIWSVGAFQHLEKLNIWSVVVKRLDNNDINMDSFLTGIPVSICKNLQNQEQLMLHLINCPFREAFTEVIRGRPNVLQLTNLKELVIYVHPKSGLKELPDDPPFISMVSVWYALQMMPNLRVQFMNDELTRYTPSFREGFDKGVLKTVFKQVQDYIKLEPFFY